VVLIAFTTFYLIRLKSKYKNVRRVSAKRNHIEQLESRDEQKEFGSMEDNEVG